MSPEPSCVHKTNKNWLPWQHSLRDRKTYFGLIISSYSSTNPENSAQIGPVDFEIIGSTEIVKKEETAADHIGGRAAAVRFQPHHKTTCI